MAGTAGALTARIVIVTVTGATLALGGAAIVAPGALAMPTAPADTVISLTSQQLTSIGFPTKPNTTAWDPGTATLPTNSAPQWQDVVITGKAPGYAPPGQLLTMYRFQATSASGDGQLKPLNITTNVKPNGTFAMHVQLGFPGTYGYAIGYSTGGTSPEMVAFQFQFTTTGSSQGAPSSSSSAVQLSAKQFAAAGFTRTPNVVGWGGTASISASSAKAGTPVTISGTAPAEVKPGSVLTLHRFVPTDRQGSGHFEPVGNVSTLVAADGTFSLTFEINQPGRAGYSLGTTVGQEWVGIEFQLKTT